MAQGAVDKPCPKIEAKEKRRENKQKHNKDVAHHLQNTAHVHQPLNINNLNMGNSILLKHY